jgi:hypothetical protein
VENKIPHQKDGKITEKQRAARRENIVRFNQSRNGRPALTHGVGTLLRTGEVPESVPGAIEVRENVAALIEQAVIDLGGPDQVTSTQRQVLESSRLALTVVALGTRYLAREGLMDRRHKKPHGLLSILASYCNVVRLNAEQLGLTRRAKDAHTVDSVIREYAAKGGNGPATDA